MQVEIGVVTREKEKCMEIYKGTLTLKKLTSKMVVYGNDDLSAQYVPKTMFKGRGKHPSSLVFTLTIPDTGKGAHNQPGQHRPKTPRLTSAEKATKNTPS
jgi:hypothetical protein